MIFALLACVSGKPDSVGDSGAPPDSVDSTPDSDTGDTATTETHDPLPSR
jgi:hypothetical protein